MKTTLKSIIPSKTALLKEYREPLTIESFRLLPGCEHYSEEEAKEVLESVNQFAAVLLKTVKPENSHSIDNQLNVYLNPGQSDPKLKKIRSEEKQKKIAA